MSRPLLRLAPFAAACVLCAAHAHAQAPVPDSSTLSLLGRITLADATSGDEGSVRSVLRAELGSEVAVERTPKGDLLVKLPGKPGGPVILLSAHMDEVGFQVRSITPDGFLTVAPLGNWYAGSIANALVTVHTAHGAVPGVVGIRPPHRMTPAEKTQAPGVLQMYIDIGVSSREQAQSWGVRLGDRITPHSEFLPLGNAGRYVSKAWDDRVSCALLAQVARAMKNTPHDATIEIAWTSSEEFGRDNGTVEAPDLKPDLVLVVEVGLTADTPDSRPGERAETLGAGPALDLYDGSISTPPALRDWITAEAREAGVPLQYSTIAEEGFGVFPENSSYLFRAPSTALLVPLRYAHSPHGVIDLHDYVHTRALLEHLLRSFNAEALRQIDGKE